MTHTQLVSKLFKPGSEILDELTPRNCALTHAILGISGEAGELLDAVKKHVIYGKPLDLQNVIEELGDLEFFLEALRQMLFINRQDTLNANVAKLSRRYSTGAYSNSQAQARADKTFA